MTQHVEMTPHAETTSRPVHAETTHVTRPSAGTIVWGGLLLLAALWAVAHTVWGLTAVTRGNGSLLLMALGAALLLASALAYLLRRRRSAAGEGGADGPGQVG